MQAYQNLGGDSGVANYETGPDHIKVQFKRGGTYTYNYESAGQEKIEQMKALANQGHGLNAYINRHVKDLYSDKE